MLYLPFARDRRIWLPSPYLRGRPQAVTTTPLLSTLSLGTANTATGSAPVGAVVFAAMNINPGGPGTTLSMTDSGGNTWTNQQGHTGSVGGGAVAIFSAVLTTAITSGSTTFAVSDSINGNVTAASVVFIYVLNSVQIATPLVVVGASNAQTTASTTAGVGSATISASPCYGIMAVGTQTVGVTGTPPGGGWSELSDTNTSNLSLQVNHNVKNDNATVANSETISSAVVSSGAQVFFRLGIHNRLTQQQNPTNALNRGSW